MRELPAKVYAVPGQHDLPHHRYEDMKRSAYGTLVEAERITDLRLGGRTSVDCAVGLYAYGFPWGYDPAPKKVDRTAPANSVHLAVVHRYLWTDGHTFPDAPIENGLAKTLPLLEGYDAAVFGDNHTPFHRGKVYNHGLFMRRRSDERRLQPQVGILHEDGAISTVDLDASADVWADSPADELERIGVDAAGLVALLRSAGDAVESFRETARRHLEFNGVAAGVREAVLGWLDAKEPRWR